MPKRTFLNLPPEKREKILAVSISEFAARGFEHASISHIVGESGISKGSFYQYFIDKDDLYEYIIVTYILEQKNIVFRENEQLLKSVNMAGFLRFLYRYQVQEFINQPEIAKISLDFNENASGILQKKITAKHEDPYQTYFIRYIREEKARGEIDPAVDETLLNYMLLALGKYTAKLLTGGVSEYTSLTEAQVDMIVDKLEYILTHGIYTIHKNNTLEA